MFRLRSGTGRLGEGAGQRGAAPADAEGAKGLTSLKTEDHRAWQAGEAGRVSKHLTLDSLESGLGSKVSSQQTESRAGRRLGVSP